MVQKSFAGSKLADKTARVIVEQVRSEERLKQRRETAAFLQTVQGTCQRPEYVSTSRVCVNVSGPRVRVKVQSTCQRVNVQSACQPVSVQRVCRPVHVQDTSVRVGLSMCRICVGLSTCKIRVSLSTCRKRVSLTALETTACPGQANLYPGR